MADKERHFIVIGIKKGFVDKVNVYHNELEASERKTEIETSYSITYYNAEIKRNKGTAVHLCVDEGKVK